MLSMVKIAAASLVAQAAVLALKVDDTCTIGRACQGERTIQKLRMSSAPCNPLGSGRHVQVHNVPIPSDVSASQTVSRYPPSGKRASSLPPRPSEVRNRGRARDMSRSRRKSSRNRPALHEHELNKSIATSDTQYGKQEADKLKAVQNELEQKRFEVPRDALIMAQVRRSLQPHNTNNYNYKNNPTTTTFSGGRHSLQRCNTNNYNNNPATTTSFGRHSHQPYHSNKNPTSTSTSSVNKIGDIAGKIVNTDMKELMNRYPLTNDSIKSLIVNQHQQRLNANNN